MAYDTETLLKTALEAIEKNKLFFVEDVVAYLPCTKATFYDHFPVESDELNLIKEALNQNRVEIKVSMRSKWFKSDNPTLQVALMKIIATDEEAHRLNGSRQEVDVKTDGKAMPAATIINLGSGVKPEDDFEDNGDEMNEGD